MLASKWSVVGTDVLDVLFTIYIFSIFSVFFW